MSRPAIFSDMADAFVSGLGNVEASVTIKGSPVPLTGILRKVRETDLLDIEGMGLEGVSYSFAASGTPFDGVRQSDTITIIRSDDAQDIGKVFLVAGHIDDGRAMKRLLLHEDE
ncbi:hypothetical protein P8H26_02105 [Pseudochrobactrum sp. sp1633]|uniref:head-tail joining protein n=1 Tax=Pseudochrobactrum sp. sp1633 TaxID=3036706 RepID=UPI0025A5B30B|nr:hypothetical protein [Pseudochrobactrum sp. sp1633]MDM8344180.1 hypothetical protein [Pseudochrobactrum sp. sp1633]